jgi:regulatory protein
VIRRPAGRRDDTSSSRRVVPDDGGFETVAPIASEADREKSGDDGQAVHRRARPAARSPDDGFPDADDTSAGGYARKPEEPRGPSLKARAVGYLSRREYARNELSRKLSPYSDDPQELESILDTLEREGWLSTERFAQSLVHRRSPQQGAARIVQELRQHGVAEDQIGELRDTLRASEYERALAVWQKRYGEKPVDRAAYAKQARFMAARGFAHDVIRRVLGSGGAMDDDGAL